MKSPSRSADLATRRWRAVVARDPRHDVAFVYAVRSTGVYCRPSCAARRPQRRNVEFYDRADDARAAGFRPCRRCRPDQPPADHALALVRRASAAIDRGAANGRPIAGLASALGVTRPRLGRAFRRVLGVSPRDYAAARRVVRVKTLLRSGIGISAALYEAGYGSTSRLYERAGTQLGMTPATYRKGGAGARIAYTTIPTPAGRLLVALTRRGLCAAQFGASDAELSRSLRGEFPAAIVTRDDDALAPVAAAFQDHVRGREPALDLPLDLRATAFQVKVWRALQAIPYGATQSYQEIARAIGRPRAARAVARACAANPAALVIPCHRVLRTDGGSGGYRWGIERKRKLLVAEAAHQARAAADG